MFTIKSKTKNIVTIFLLTTITTPIYAKTPNEKEVSQRIKTFETHFRNGNNGTIEERMALHHVPGMSIAMIKNGKLSWAKGYGVKQAGNSDKVDTQTVFSVASISKVAAAAATLRLVEQGKLDLDRNVNDYLTRWKVAKNKFTENQPVTLKHIMSHTAGFSIHGFPDFQPGEKLPNVVDTLTGRPPAKHGPVVVKFTPGTKFKYSGGGVTVEQLIIEEVTLLDFVIATQKLVFKPLSMHRSTFKNPLPATHENIAKAHDPFGKPRALPRGWETMPEMAASGLWTTPSELALLMIALIESHQGQKDSFINKNLAHKMMTRVEPSQFGLGPALPEKDLFVHDGSNDSYRAIMVGNLKTGNGIVVLTNGRNGHRMLQEVLAIMKQIEQ